MNDFFVVLPHALGATLAAHKWFVKGRQCSLIQRSWLSIMVRARNRAPLQGTAEHPGGVGVGLALPSSALNNCGDSKPSPYGEVVIDGLGNEFGA